MAYLYPIPPGSLVLYGYYLVRMKDLMRRHGAAAWRLLHGDRELVETLRRRDALREHPITHKSINSNKIKYSCYFKLC
jgi:hypothetical protein